ncbi:MAG: TRL domain-containing protein [Treponemataceae bacterium]
MKKAIFIVLALTVVLFASCVSTWPITSTGSNLGSKVGQATTTVIFGLPLQNSDCSIASAAKNGGITKVSTVDVKLTNYFVFCKITTTVRGD